MNLSDQSKQYQSSAAQRAMVKSCIAATMGDAGKISRLFYKALFLQDPNLKSLLAGNEIFLNRKFTNMLSSFRDVKHIEEISDSIGKMGERHMLDYGVQIASIETARPALMVAFRAHLGERFDDELQAAWNAVYDDVAMLMVAVMKRAERRKVARTPYDNERYDEKLLDDIGGRERVKQVHQRFYDAIFDEPWLGKFFWGKPKEILIKKQTDFMVGALGGDNQYRGDTPAFSHMHIYITDEMADLREKILRQAILDEGLSESIARRWLKIDSTFRTGIVKQSIDECVLKCPGQRPATATKPDYYHSDKK